MFTNILNCQEKILDRAVSLLYDKQGCRFIMPKKS